MSRKQTYRWTQPNKYKAVRSLSSDGKHFASKLECAVYDLLRLRYYAREIKEIKLQQTVRVTPDVKWKIDFSFVEVSSGELVYAEAKGLACGLYKMKLALYRKYIPNRLEIYKGSYKKPCLYEIINPQKGK